MNVPLTSYTGMGHYYNVMFPPCEVGICGMIPPSIKHIVFSIHWKKYHSAYSFYCLKASFILSTVDIQPDTLWRRETNYVAPNLNFKLPHLKLDFLIRPWTPRLIRATVGAHMWTRMQQVFDNSEKTLEFVISLDELTVTWMVRSIWISANLSTPSNSLVNPGGTHRTHRLWSSSYWYASSHVLLHICG